MRTIKVIGSGPLAGMTAYGTVAHMDVLSDDGVVLEMDGVETIGDRPFSRVTVSALTGALKAGDRETDLVMVDKSDREYLRECHARWSGSVAKAA